MVINDLNGGFMKFFIKNTLAVLKNSFLLVTIFFFHLNFCMEQKSYIAKAEAINLANLMGESITPEKRDLYKEIVTGEIEIICNENKQKSIEEEVLNKIIENASNACKLEKESTPVQKKKNEPSQMIFPRENAIAYAISKCEINNKKHQLFYKAFITTGINGITQKQTTITESSLNQIIQLGLTALKTIENDEGKSLFLKHVLSHAKKIELYKESALDFATNINNIRYYLLKFGLPADLLKNTNLFNISDRIATRIRHKYKDKNFMTSSEILTIIKEICSTVINETPESKKSAFKPTSTTQKGSKFYTNMHSGGTRTTYTYNFFNPDGTKTTYTSNSPEGINFNFTNPFFQKANFNKSESTKSSYKSNLSKPAQTNKFHCSSNKFNPFKEIKDHGHKKCLITYHPDKHSDSEKAIATQKTTAINLTKTLIENYQACFNNIVNNKKLDDFNYIFTNFENTSASKADLTTLFNLLKELNHNNSR